MVVLRFPMPLPRSFQRDTNPGLKDYNVLVGVNRVVFITARMGKYKSKN